MPWRTAAAMQASIIFRDSIGWNYYACLSDLSLPVKPVTDDPRYKRLGVSRERHFFDKKTCSRRVILLEGTVRVLRNHRTRERKDERR
jgi:hypothetical protein